MHLEIRKSLLNQEWDSYREQAKNGASVRRETSVFHHKKTFRLSQNVALLLGECAVALPLVGLHVAWTRTLARGDLAASLS